MLSIAGSISLLQRLPGVALGFGYGGGHRSAARDQGRDGGGQGAAGAMILVRQPAPAERLNQAIATIEHILDSGRVLIAALGQDIATAVTQQCLGTAVAVARAPARRRISSALGVSSVAAGSRRLSSVVVNASSANAAPPAATRTGSSTTGIEG